MAWEWCSLEDKTSDTIRGYYDAITHPMSESWSPVCVLLVNGAFYVSPVKEVTSKYDIGPYATLEEAQIAAEVLCGMGVFGGE